MWTGRSGEADAGSVLREFVAAEDNAGKERYHPFRTRGGLTGVEVEYLYTSKLLGATKTESALAVGTPEGPVVLHPAGWTPRSARRCGPPTKSPSGRPS
ncbi:lipoprotein [Streptomyces sp. NPDC001852]|uniref:lipoprotein n=1 Tax=Streptomyces sp. NPDC001852 TaxID=3364619 RepID=UPI0036CF4942